MDSSRGVTCSVFKVRPSCAFSCPCRFSVPSIVRGFPLATLALYYGGTPFTIYNMVKFNTIYDMFAKKVAFSIDLVTIFTKRDMTFLKYPKS